MCIEGNPVMRVILSPNCKNRLLLITSNNVVFESFHCEHAIIAVNVLDPDVIALGKQLKTFFGLRGGLDCCLFMAISMQIT